MPAAAARWIVPAAVTALVVGGGVAASASSDGVPDLPERSAADLLVSIGEAEPTPFSGTVRTVADLGLPDLGDLGDMAGAGGSESASDPASALMGLATGEHSLQVWVGGPDQQRVSLPLEDFAELGFVHDGDVAWTYSSSDDTATRYDLAAMAERAEAAAAEHAAEHGGPLPEPAEPALPDEAAPFADMTPDELARTLLAEADETTEVSVGEAQVVAGRDAYTLVATPRDDATLVAGIEVAVDAATGLVLQVQVDARGQEAPAFLTGFTALELGRPDADGLRLHAARRHHGRRRARGARPRARRGRSRRAPRRAVRSSPSTRVRSRRCSPTPRSRSSTARAGPRCSSSACRRWTTPLPPRGPTSPAPTSPARTRPRSAAATTRARTSTLPRCSAS
jgi:hypothetical protein